MKAARILALLLAVIVLVAAVAVIIAAQYRDDIAR